MGVGQSTELADDGHKAFAYENAEALKAYMIRLNDTAEFVARRLWLDSERHEDSPESPDASVSSRSAGGQVKNDARAPDVSEADEERAMWLPFTHMLFANHYMSDSSLLEPLTVSYFYPPHALGSSSGEDENEDGQQNGAAEVTEGGDGTVAVPMNALDILSRNASLQTLDLGFNNLTARIMKPLVAAWHSMHHLRSVSLAGNTIGEKGCVLLGGYLAKNPSLERLSLFQCGLDDAAIVPLLQGLANPLATGLDGERGSVLMRTGSAASSRRSSGTESPEGNTHLRYLDLNFNNLTDLSVRRFMHLVYCDHSRRSSGHSTSTIATTETTREAMSAAQTEADESVTCVGTGNSTLAVILYESCPHDPNTLRVLDPYVYMSGRRLEYACTASGYFRSGNDYRPEDVMAMTSSNSSGGGGGVHGAGGASAMATVTAAAGGKRSASFPTTVGSTSTLRPPSAGAIMALSLSHSAPRRNSSSANGAGAGLDDVDPHMAGPLDVSENVYYDGTFVEQELAVVSEAQRKVAGRERYRLRKALLTRDFAGLQPFDPFLRRHLSALLAKRRLAYEQELRHQRRLVMEAAVQDATKRVEGGRDGYARDQGHGTPASSPAALATTDDGSAAGDVVRTLPGGVAQTSVQGHPRPASGSVTDGRNSVNGDTHVPTRGAGEGGAQFQAAPWRPPRDADEPRARNRHSADVSRRTSAKTGTVTKGGLDYRVVPNGFDKVLLAASTHGLGRSTNGDGEVVAAAVIPVDRQRNKIVSGSRANYLEACWCDPKDASVLYGGVLHYHCIREQAAMYGGAAAANSVHETRGEEAARKGVAAAPKGGLAQNAHDDADVERAKRVVQQRQLAYRACQQTGHRCVSQCRQKYASQKRSSALPSLTPHPSQTRTASLKGGTLAETHTGTLPAIGGGRRDARTVHTTQGGMTFALNYNPVVYFSSAYVPSAPIIDECNM